MNKALARLLRPLVRLCIHSGVTFPRLCDLLREIYVNAVEHDFSLPIKQQTDSRVSLLTGIHRKEVRRLRGLGVPRSDVPRSVSRTSRILAKWTGSPPFIDAYGHPLPLPRFAEGSAASFERLVASVTRDIRPRAVLDDWLARELVDIDAADIVRLRVDSLVPKAGDEQQLYYFGRNLHDHIAASVHNVIGDAPPFFERAVHYDGLSAPLARQLEHRARDIAMSALQSANREANVASESDDGGSSRWIFGIYIYAVDEAPSATDSQSPSQGESNG